MYIRDTGGDENYRLYAVNIDGSGYKELTPFEGVRAGIVDPLEDNDDEMLISLNRRDPRVFDVYRINIHTGAMELAAENPGNVSEWLTDNDGRLRVAVTTDGVQSSLLYRETEKDPFRTVVTTDFKNTLDPLFFSFDNRRLYVASNIGRDKTAVYLYDVQDGRFLDLIYEHPEVDVSGLLRSKARKVITGVAFTTDKPQYEFFDSDRRQLQAALEARLPGRRVAVTGMSRDERRVIVRTFSDKSLGASYLYDHAAGRLEKLAELSPWLNESELADVRPIRFMSRDGLTIHGYLTLPKGANPGRLPVVVNPHGGPWTRDVWRFNPEAQFLANRGVGVLQINFRGSTGYGKAFWEAGFKQWGGKMQDDITDGVGWLIQEGIADPQRIAIYGASYGGYAVLAGLAFTPDLYACGIDYVGVSNIFTLLETLPPYWELGRRMMYEMVGDPVEGPGTPDAGVAGLSRRKDQGPAAGGPGRQRPPGQEGRVGPDRAGAAAKGGRCRLHREGQRGPRVPQRGEPLRLLPPNGRVPGPAPGQSRGKPAAGFRRQGRIGCEFARCPGSVYSGVSVSSMWKRCSIRWATGTRNIPIRLRKTRPLKMA